MKRKLVLFSVTLLAVGLLGYFGARLAVIHALASVDLKVRPFVATIQHSVTKGGQKIVTADEMVVRARSGGIVHVTTAYRPDGSIALDRARRVELPDGFIAMVADAMKAKATGRRSEQTMAQTKAALQNYAADCVERGAGSSEKLDGEDLLFGQRAARIAIVQGGVTQTVWRLVEFNCQTVQVVTERGPETLTSKLTSFLPVDPQPNLFVVDSSYKEMPPSQLIRVQTGKNLPLSDADRQMDKNYADDNK